MAGSPTWEIGEVLTAAGVNAWLVPATQSRTADQSVTSSTALVDDNTLAAAVAANATYHVEAVLIFVGGTQGSSDLKIAWTAPAGVTMNWVAAGKNTGGTNTWTDAQTTPGATVALGTSGATVRMAKIEGTLVTGATAGTLQLQWAQNTSSGTATTMKTGSVLQLTRTA